MRKVFIWNLTWGGRYSVITNIIRVKRHKHWLLQWFRDKWGFIRYTDMTKINVKNFLSKIGNLRHVKPWVRLEKCVVSFSVRVVRKKLNTPCRLFLYRQSFENTTSKYYFNITLKIKHIFSRNSFVKVFIKLLSYVYR